MYMYTLEVLYPKHADVITIHSLAQVIHTYVYRTREVAIPGRGLADFSRSKPLSRFLRQLSLVGRYSTVSVRVEYNACMYTCRHGQE